MQKALTQMNVQLDRVVSDLTGKTGLSILRRVVAGERDPKPWRSCVTVVCERMRRPWLEAWRQLAQEHLFAPGQALAQFDFLGAQIKECDAAIAVTGAAAGGWDRRRGDEQSDEEPAPQRAAADAFTGTVFDAGR